MIKEEVFFFGTDTVKFSVPGKRKQVPDAKTSQPSSFDKSLNNENSSKKEISKQPVFTIPKVKSEKSTTTGISKQSSFTKLPSTLQQNIHTDSKLTDDHPKNSLSIEQSASVALNANVLCETPISPKQSLLLTQNPPPPEIKKGNKDEKKIVVKNTQKCIHCQSEAKVNSCYCSDDCIEKYAIQCIQTLREAREDLKDVEFDSQKLTVFNGLKSDSTITESGPTTGEVVSWLKANPCYMISCSMQNDVSLQKNECDSSTEKKDAAKANVRVNVKKTLKNILMDRCKNADDIEMPEADIQRIAIKIEEELNSLYKDNNNRYRTKYRSLMFNIKDPRNQGLFRKNSKRYHTSWTFSTAAKSGSGLLIKKTHKGEVEIGDDLTSIVKQEIPEVILKDVPDDVVEPEKKKEVKDSTHLHRSHLFDLNCKICTGKIVPPPVEDVPKKVSKEKLLKSNVGDDLMDQEPTPTVSESTDINVNSAVKEIVSKGQSSVWKGFIFMQDIAKFVTSAYKVSGRTDRLQFELIYHSLQAANEEEAVAYDKFYSYLSNRKRYGVVANYSKKIKDFYLLPLAATSPVPVVLVPFDGPGIYTVI
ncbi:PHD finger protein 3 [Caerostris extrusa]|uniref:PHD finger protein 3 n=1 Tax=Caerostris extrusa TaxID=172846 RepID=A0AAV4RMH6_CAEEX|nr:PHD finger protein 3 [Caerostris extrusa]